MAEATASSRHLRLSLPGPATHYSAPFNLQQVLASSNWDSDGASMRDPSLYTGSGPSDGFTEPDFNPVPDTADLGVPHQVVSMTLTFLITFSAIGLFAYLCLLIGSSRGNRYLLLPAMILDMLILVLSTFTYIALMIVTFSYDTGLGVAYMLGGFVGNASCNVVISEPGSWETHLLLTRMVFRRRGRFWRGLLANQCFRLSVWVLHYMERERQTRDRRNRETGLPDAVLLAMRVQFIPTPARNSECNLVSYSDLLNWFKEPTSL
uniref:Uncharacterized protein n=1 Tax=Timema cristinae TaxID=61476 RepID=A0A7R9HA41_TIMCR|nr:unnamed protein product [Timema cristinae]